MSAKKLNNSQITIFIINHINDNHIKFEVSLNFWGIGSTVRRNLKIIIKSQLTINFMFPVPEASVPAVLICSDKSAPGNIISAMDTL